MQLKPGLWIRIRMDPHSFSLLAPDPDSGGKILRKNRKNARKLEVIVILLKKSKLGLAPWFLIFKQSFMSFSTLCKANLLQILFSWIRICIEKNSWIRIRINFSSGKYFGCKFVFFLRKVDFAVGHDDAEELEGQVPRPETPVNDDWQDQRQQQRCGHGLHPGGQLRHALCARAQQDTHARYHHRSGY